MLAIPLDKLVILNPRLLLRAPQLYHPRKHPQVVIHPIVEHARNDLLGVVAKVVVDGNGRVAGDLGALFSDLLIRPQVLRRKGFILFASSLLVN